MKCTLETIWIWSKLTCIIVTGVVYIPLICNGLTLNCLACDSNTETDCTAINSVFEQCTAASRKVCITWTDYKLYLCQVLIVDMQWIFFSIHLIRCFTVCYWWFQNGICETEKQYTAGTVSRVIRKCSTISVCEAKASPATCSTTPVKDEM